MSTPHRQPPPPEPRPATYRFGRFVLDADRGALSGPGGAELGLRPKTAGVLRHLVENAGRLVPREDLMRAVWPGVFVTDDSITQCVTEIRRALGDDGQRLLRTLPRRGYLLAAEAAPGAAPRPALPAPEGAAAAAAVASRPGSERGEPRAPALPDRPSLAVLPFANPGGDPEREYFADGVTEELTAALTHVRWFSVAARNSAFTYKGRPVDVRQVGRELGVRYVLEGSVRKAGGQVRISCRLVEADAGGQVWAERFEGAYGDIFALEDRVAAAVAGAVEPSISRAEVARVRAKPTESLDAYDLYLRALPHHYCLTRRDNDAALALLRRAIALDPTYALAKGLLGSCHALRVMQGWLEPSDREEAVRLAREVLAGARDEPRALAYAARTLGYVGRERELALAAAERAVALNANSAMVLGIAGWISLYGGSPTVAAERFRRAIQLSPLDPEMAAFLAGLAYAHLRTREYEEALAFGLRAIREMPERATCHRAVIAALSCLGRRDEAAAAAARYRELVGPAGFHVFAERVSAVTADQEFTAMMIRSLREAGVPE